MITVTVGLDAAADSKTALVPNNWLGPDHEDPDRRNALLFDHWADITPDGTAVWLNPPHAPAAVLRGFLQRAVATAAAGTEVWALVPAQTGTTWFQELVLDAGGTPQFLGTNTATVGRNAAALVKYAPAATNQANQPDKAATA